MRESVFTHTTPPPFAARVCCAVAGLETGAPLPGVPEGVAAVGAAGLLAVAGDAAGVSDGVCAAASACFGFLSFLAGLESALGDVSSSEQQGRKQCDVRTLHAFYSRMII